MLYWQRQGTGTEVVLVHGFLGSSKTTSGPVLSRISLCINGCYVPFSDPHEAIFSVRY